MTSSAYPWGGEPPPVTVMHTPVLSSYDLQLDLVQVIQLRVREGFNISDVTVLDDEEHSEAQNSSVASEEGDQVDMDDERRDLAVVETQKKRGKLSVKVTLEWQPSVRIEYHVFEKR